MSNEKESSDSTHHATNDEKVFARKMLLEEIKHRRDKEWKIFASATLILLAIIAAVVGISARPGSANLTAGHRVVLVVSQQVITVAAGFWLWRNLDKEEEIIQQLKKGNWSLEVLPGPSRFNRLPGYIPALVLLFLIATFAIFLLGGSEPPRTKLLSESANGNSANGTWYFAVSGDSRDCGDLIMPKIAQAIADGRQSAPVDFYWHLGDLRAIYRVDCDMAKRANPETRCAQELPSGHKDLEKNDTYVAAAWPDYIEHQIRPFEKAGIGFLVGIGNHELVEPKTRGQFRQQFKEWLTKNELQEQRAIDRANGIASKDGDTYFHFIRKGVDLIYLDNASINDDKDSGFTEEELTWLDLVLKRDEADPQVRTVIVGMHAALPESVSKDHAMDKTCASLCAGKRAYDRLGVTQSKGKRVYVMASHSHYFEEYIYDTPEHNGHGLRGWIIGTAGAEQYRSEIRYGYLLVQVGSDGAIHTSFERVYADSPPKGPDALARYCFEQNKRPPKEEKYKTAAECACPSQ
jgi:hypothetical protein